MTLAVSIGTVALRNPILTASGTCGYGLEMDPYFDIAELGGICTKGLSLEPRAGNPPERIAETPAGMLNAIGLANVGVEAFIREKLPPLRARGVTVVANVFGSTVAEYVALVERLSDVEGVAAIELNVSCPNTERGGMEFGVDPDAAAEVTSACRRVSRRPLWVKLSPEVASIAEIARAVEGAGADALTVMNTIRGLAIDVKTRRPRLSHVTGGLSGPAIRPIAVRLVWGAARAVRIPVVGIGGIMTGEDVVEFLLAGASAVQVGTASFVDPRAPRRILEEVSVYCEREGVTPADLVGKIRDGR